MLPLSNSSVNLLKYFSVVDHISGDGFMSNQSNLHAKSTFYSIVVLQSLGCAKANASQSDSTVSSDNSPIDVSRHQQRRSRPRSLVINWRSPSYASDTISSMQLKAFNSGCGNKRDGTSNVSTGVVCSRFRKFKSVPVDLTEFGFYVTEREIVFVCIRSFNFFSNPF